MENTDVSKSVEETFGGRLATNDSEQAKNMPAYHKNDKFKESVTDDIDGQQVKYAEGGAANIAVRAALEQKYLPIESTTAREQKVKKDPSRSAGQKSENVVSENQQIGYSKL